VEDCPPLAGTHLHVTALEAMLQCSSILMSIVKEEE
jgi:hypothetical protein